MNTGAPNLRNRIAHLFHCEWGKGALAGIFGFGTRLATVSPK
jgi:hypothetical protein